MITVFILYLAVLVVFAIWSRRETGTLAGFFLAGRKLPSWVVAFSANATGESGWLLLGLTGMGYAVGAGGTIAAWSGSSWIGQSSPVSSRLNAVSVIGGAGGGGVRLVRWTEVIL